jgi:hypothetical protein
MDKITQRIKKNKAQQDAGLIKNFLWQGNTTWTMIHKNHRKQYTLYLIF